MAFDENGFEGIIKQQCAKLLESPIAQSLPTDCVEAIVAVAFATGAAWAFGGRAMSAMADRVMDTNVGPVQ